MQNYRMQVKLIFDKLCKNMLIVKLICFIGLSLIFSNRPKQGNIVSLYNKIPGKYMIESENSCMIQLGKKLLEHCYKDPIIVRKYAEY